MPDLRMRVLGRSGLRVSELCLGTMTFGTEWGFGADEDTCRAVYRAFRDAGGNYVDTANVYTNGTSEEMLGRFAATDRDELVLGTKFTLPTTADPNSGGSHRKSLRRSVEASLRRLGTDHLDVLWVHAWDRCTPVEETLRALDDLVRSGLVLALGVSNTPAWVISRAQAVAELRGWASFCGVQVEYSLVARTAERELLPMAEELGLSVSAWSPLARGLLTGKVTDAAALRRSRAAARAIEAASHVAEEAGTSVARVGLAWVLQRGLLPLVGARTVEQLEDNLAAVDLTLDRDQLRRLDEATAIRPGHPHDFLATKQAVLTPAGVAASGQRSGEV